MRAKTVEFLRTASNMLNRDRNARGIENSVLTGCLLRCGRIDLMIGEQSRFVSQEYRAFGRNAVKGQVTLLDLSSIKIEQRKDDLLVDWAGPVGCPH